MPSTHRRKSSRLTSKHPHRDPATAATPTVGPAQHPPLPYNEAKTVRRAAIMASPASAYYSYRTPHGMLTIGARGDVVCRIAFGTAPLPGIQQPTAATNRASTELLEYFSGKRRTFDLPLRLQGSTFQQQVWNEVCALPYAHTATAADIAAAIGHPGAHRAVGAALRRCPAPIVVPTHRVVNAAGKPWGSGQEARVRGALLQMERTFAQEERDPS